MAVNAFEYDTIIDRLRARGISSSDLSDDTLHTLIDDCLEEYLFYRPKYAMTAKAKAIYTVADKPNYSKPTDAMWIIDVAWNPDYNTALSDLYEEILLKTLDSEDTTQIQLYYDQLQKLHAFFRGHWEIINDEIYLIPMPDAGYYVPVFYAATRPLSELDQVADRRFLDLCYFSALLSVGVTKQTSGGWRAGSFSVDGRVGQVTVDYAERKLEQTRQQIANSFAVQRS